MTTKKSSNAGKMSEMVESVKARGWITYDEASEFIAELGATPGTVRRFLRRMEAAGVEVTAKPGRTRKGDRRRTAKVAENTNVLSAEPVQTYLDWMGAVSLLTREGEVELARQIERGRQTIYDAILEHSLHVDQLGDITERVTSGELAVREAVIEPQFEAVLEALGSYVESCSEGAAARKKAEACSP